MNIKFFRAYRGEGKTKWLFERAVEAKNDGYKLVYVGKSETMQGLSYTWRAELHEMCPIEHVSYEMDRQGLNGKYCFLTDELLNNMSTVGFYYPILSDKDGVWYITMDQSNFVN
jgi:hypothetical protein